MPGARPATLKASRQASTQNPVFIVVKTRHESTAHVFQSRIATRSLFSCRFGCDLLWRTPSRGRTLLRLAANGDWKCVYPGSGNKFKIDDFHESGFTHIRISRECTLLDC